MVTASLVTLFGLVGLYDAVHQWTTAPSHCPPPQPGYRCVELIGTSGPSVWQEFGIGTGAVTIGVGLFLLADRVKRRRAARLSPG